MKLQLRELFYRILKLCLILALITLFLLQWKALGLSQGTRPVGLAFADLLIALSGAGWFAARSGIGAPHIFVKILVGILSAAVATVTLGALLIAVAMVPGSLPHGGGHHSRFD